MHKINIATYNYVDIMYCIYILYYESLRYKLYTPLRFLKWVPVKVCNEYLYIKFSSSGYYMQYLCPLAANQAVISYLLVQDIHITLGATRVAPCKN